MGKMTFTSDLALRRIEQIKHMLLRDDLTTQEIADGIYVHLRTAQSYVSYLHANRMIHITRYRKVMREFSGEVAVALWCWGSAKDAPRPAPMTPAEWARRYRNNPDKIDTIRAKARARWWKPRRDWTAAWIPKQEAR